jgi:hypothetical protein
MTQRWYVVCDWDAYKALHKEPPASPRPAASLRVWTVSRNPTETGWETDSGCPGYGLTYAEAKELVDAVNKSP